MKAIREIKLRNISLAEAKKEIYSYLQEAFIEGLPCECYIEKRWRAIPEK